MNNKKKREIRSIYIEQAENGHTVTAHFKMKDRDPSKYWDSNADQEKTVHENCCDVANKIHELIGGSDHDIRGSEGGEEEDE